MAEQRLVTIEKQQSFEKAMDFVMAEMRYALFTDAEMPNKDYFIDKVLLEHKKILLDPSYCYGELNKIRDISRPVFKGQDLTDKTILDKMSIGELTRTSEDLQEHYETTTAYIKFLILAKKSDLQQKSADV